ncbi:MAG: hypothetical protein GX591_17605 [Planctomycetes bacterium]|nr:hypothetical protein [Planctomycetota bacterium]
MLYCSHILEVVERICDRVIILDKGRIIADGTPAEQKTLMKQESLESVFQSLTSDEDAQAVSAAFLDAIHPGKRARS